MGEHGGALLASQGQLRWQTLGQQADSIPLCSLTVMCCFDGQKVVVVFFFSSYSCSASSRSGFVRVIKHRHLVDDGSCTAVGIRNTLGIIFLLIYFFVRISPPHTHTHESIDVTWPLLKVPYLVIFFFLSDFMLKRPQSAWKSSLFLEITLNILLKFAFIYCTYCNKNSENLLNLEGGGGGHLH